MKVMTKTLPSRGYGKPVEFIDIEPLTYRELRNYTSKSYQKGTVDSLIWDIECLIQDIEGWQTLSSFDITAIIFTRKYMSASFGDKVKLDLGGQTYELSMSEINFKDLSKELIRVNKIILNGHVFLFSLPTIEHYYKILKAISQGAIVIDGEVDLDIVYLASCLINITKNENTSIFKRKSYASIKKSHYSNTDEAIENFITAYNDINSCIQSDVAFVNRLLHLLTDKTHDVTVFIEGGASVVNLDRLITDIFRFIEVNEGVNSNKVIYIE